MVKKNADFNGTFNGTTPNLREFRHPVELQSVLVDLFWSVGMNIVLSAWSHNANYGLYLWLEPSRRGTMDPDDQKGAEREGVGAGGGCGEGGWWWRGDTHSSFSFDFSSWSLKIDFFYVTKT